MVENRKTVLRTVSVHFELCLSYSCNLYIALQHAFNCLEYLIHSLHVRFIVIQINFYSLYICSTVLHIRFFMI